MAGGKNGTQDNRFIFEPLDYLRQAGEYYYFDTDVVENGRQLRRPLRELRGTGISNKPNSVDA
jgi:hypothetical protein